MEISSSQDKKSTLYYEILEQCILQRMEDEPGKDCYSFIYLFERIHNNENYSPSVNTQQDIVEHLKKCNRCLAYYFSLSMGYIWVCGQMMKIKDLAEKIEEVKF